jgi:hypothetical protein
VLLEVRLHLLLVLLQRGWQTVELQRRVMQKERQNQLELQVRVP